MLTRCTYGIMWNQRENYPRYYSFDKNVDTRTYASSGEVPQGIVIDVW